MSKHSPIITAKDAPVVEGEDGKVRSRESSVTGSPAQVTRGLKHLQLEEEWDLLSSSSETASQSEGEHDDDEDERDFANSPSGGPRYSSSSSSAYNRLDSEQTGKSTTFDANVLNEWRHVSGIATPSTQSESGASEVSELSVVSSNGFDVAFFPERNATPTLKRPLRNSSQRHEVLCQLCSEDIRGTRWMCHECPNWSVCETCFEITAEAEVHPIHTFIRIFSPADIFKILQDQPAIGIHANNLGYNDNNSVIKQPVIHFDVQCHNCAGSIIGARFDCASIYCQSKNISFCQDCEALPINCHPPSHPLIKYKLPKAFCTNLKPSPLQDDTLLKTPEPRAQDEKITLGRRAQDMWGDYEGENSDVLTLDDMRWLDEQARIATQRQTQAREAIGGLIKEVEEPRQQRWSIGEDEELSSEMKDILCIKGTPTNGKRTRTHELTLRKPWNASDNENEHFGHFPTAGPSLSVDKAMDTTMTSVAAGKQPIRSSNIQVEEEEEEFPSRNVEVFNRKESSPGVVPPSTSTFTSGQTLPAKMPRLAYSQTGLLSHGLRQQQQQQQAEEESQGQSTPKRRLSTVGRETVEGTQPEPLYSPSQRQGGDSVKAKMEHHDNDPLYTDMDLYDFFATP